MTVFPPILPREYKTAVKSAPVELYNLADDPGERVNLAVSRPEKVKELRATLDALTANAAHPQFFRLRPMKDDDR